MINVVSVLIFLTIGGLGGLVGFLLESPAVGVTAVVKNSLAAPCGR